MGRFEQSVRCESTHEAKKIIKAELERRKIPYTKLTARTINFQDLARVNCIFVKIHGWQANPVYEELSKVAVENGFRIETDWPISGG